MTNGNPTISNEFDLVSTVTTGILRPTVYFGALPPDQISQIHRTLGIDPAAALRDASNRETTTLPVLVDPAMSADETRTIQTVAAEYETAVSHLKTLVDDPEIHYQLWLKSKDTWLRSMALKDRNNEVKTTVDKISELKSEMDSNIQNLLETSMEV